MTAAGYSLEESAGQLLSAGHQAATAATADARQVLQAVTAAAQTRHSADELLEALAVLAGMHLEGVARVLGIDASLLIRNASGAVVTYRTALGGDQ